MSRTSPAYRTIVPLLAGAQAMLLACSVYVLSMGDLTVVRPVEPQASTVVVQPAVGGAEVTSSTAKNAAPERRTKPRATRKQRQRPVYQARTGAPPNPKVAALSWPVAGRVTSPFGERAKPEDRDVTEFHHGLDIGCGMGWPVRASNAGRIVALGKAKTYGNAVLIDHGNGYMTLYAHLSDFAVEYTDSVQRGQVIGQCGDTGRATGPHLHFEVRYGGYVWDPLTFLP